MAKPKALGDGTLEPSLALELRREIDEWGRAHFQRYPWRSELPTWQAVVAEFMLIRTRAAQVIPVFEEFVQRFPVPSSLGQASDRELRALVEPLGLRWRSELFVRLARVIAERGEVAPCRAELESLPGVGDYVASAVLSLHAGKRALLIDSNVVRLVCRLLGRERDGETRRKRWFRDAMEQMTPEDPRAFNYGLLDLSMLLCTPRAPRCEVCPLSGLCRFRASTDVPGGEN